jgi:hypothetical protein
MLSMKKLPLLTVSLCLALAQIPGAQAKEPAAPQTAVMQATVANPVQMFSLTADLFTRSYFAELKALSNWGPDHPLWETHLPSFQSELIRLLLPVGAELASHLSAELQRQLTPEELAELAAAVARPEFTSAAGRLQETGASWENLVLVTSIMQAPKLYSFMERQRAKAVVSALREEAQGDRARLLKEDLRPLAALLGTQIFEKYQSALGDTFMAGAKRLGETPEGRRAFESLMQRWHARLKTRA